MCSSSSSETSLRQLPSMNLPAAGRRGVGREAEDVVVEHFFVAETQDRTDRGVPHVFRRVPPTRSTRAFSLATRLASIGAMAPIVRSTDIVQHVVGFRPSHNMMVLLDHLPSQDAHKAGVVAPGMMCGLLARRASQPVSLLVPDIRGLVPVSALASGSPCPGRGHVCESEGRCDESDVADQFWSSVEVNFIHYMKAQQGQSQETARHYGRRRQLYILEDAERWCLLLDLKLGTTTLFISSWDEVSLQRLRQ